MTREFSEPCPCVLVLFGLSFATKRFHSPFMKPLDIFLSGFGENMREGCKEGCRNKAGLNLIPRTMSSVHRDSDTPSQKLKAFGSCSDLRRRLVRQIPGQ